MSISRYIDDYDGEYVVSGVTIKNGRRHRDRFWIPNSVPNSNHKKVAYIVGNGTSRTSISTFKLLHLTRASGGHLSKFKGQCYGCNAVYRDWAPDFLVCTNPDLIDDIVSDGYANNHVVFGRVTSLLKYPEYISLIPHDPHMNCGATAVYLACFHGHKRIYMLGFDNQLDSYNNNVYAGTPHYGTKDNKPDDTVWIENMSKIFNTYNDVDFVHVTRDSMVGVMPDQWKWYKNLRQINLRNFFIEADI